MARLRRKQQVWAAGIGVSVLVLVVGVWLMRIYETAKHDALYSCFSPCVTDVLGCTVRHVRTGKSVAVLDPQIMADELVACIVQHGGKWRRGMALSTIYDYEVTLETSGTSHQLSFLRKPDGEGAYWGYIVQANGTSSGVLELNREGALILEALLAGALSEAPD